MREEIPVMPGSCHPRSSDGDALESVESAEGMGKSSMRGDSLTSERLHAGRGTGGQALVDEHSPHRVDPGPEENDQLSTDALARFHPAVERRVRDE